MAILQELLNKADFYNELISSAPADNTAKIQEINNWLRSQFIFNSNALADSSISLSETRSILDGNDGICMETHPSETCCCAVTGFSQAYDYMLELSRQEALTITDEIVKKLHLLFYQHIDTASAGHFRNEKLSASAAGHRPAAPEDLPRLMSHLGDQILSSQTTLHPVELAAMAHKRLMDISPFNAGNFQVAMLLMNLILVRAGYCTVTIPAARNTDYMNALSASRKLIDMNPFSILIAECAIDSCKEYCRQRNLSTSGLPIA